MRRQRRWRWRWWWRLAVLGPLRGMRLDLAVQGGEGHPVVLGRLADGLAHLHVQDAGRDLTLRVLHPGPGSAHPHLARQGREGRVVLLLHARRHHQGAEGGECRAQPPGGAASREQRRRDAAASVASR